VTKKTRMQLVGTNWGRTTQYLNGSIFSITQLPTANLFAIRKLEESQGHRSFAQLGIPLKPRPKAPVLRLPKPYFGKDPAKRAAFFALSESKKQRYLVKFKLYQRNLLSWTEKYNRLKQAGSADTGGPFKARALIPYPALHQIYDVDHPGSSSRKECVGAFNATSLSNVNSITLDSSSDAQMDAFGTRCIAKCLPTNPISNMGQFLYELKDIPRFFDPFEWKEKARHFKKLAEKGSDEYLNVSFGWLPFISDINSFFKVTDNYTKIITQYERDSGRHIRRRTELFDTTSTTSSTVGTGQGPFPTPSTIALGGTLTKDIVLRQRVWFSGSFTYYIPPIDGSVSSYYEHYQAYAQRLFGLRLGPDLLWKITPWSWALDWFSNTGSVVRNWDAFATQGLTLHYGYVMEEKIQTTTYNLRGFKLSTNPISQLTDISQQITKRRRPATPFGFGLNPASFSPFQLGIIGALGINRGSRWL
jgi:hypothetical protein